jgi:hypothetical protein
MKEKQYLLPLYFVRKQTKSGFNEKNLIILLLISTILSIYFILKNLPTNVNIVERNQVQDLFLPKVTQKNIFHDQQNHMHQIDIPVDLKNKKKPSEKVGEKNSNDEQFVQRDSLILSPVDHENDRRREKVKEVNKF